MHMNALAMFAGWLVEKQVDPMKSTHQHAVDFVWWMAQKKLYAAKTIRQKISFINSFYRFCNNNGLKIENPFLRVLSDSSARQALKHKPRKATVLTARQLSQVLAACDALFTKKLSERLGIALSMMAFMGLRVGEVTGYKKNGCFVGGVRCRDFYLSDGFLALKIVGKGSKEAALLVDDYTKELLEQFYELPLESDEKICQMTKSWIQKCVKRIAVHTGIQFSAHDLRRTCAVHGIKSGLSVRAVQLQLRHSNITTTEIYLGGTTATDYGISVSRNSDLMRAVKEEMNKKGGE